jgi:hypothetical protein
MRSIFAAVFAVAVFGTPLAPAMGQSATPRATAVPLPTSAPASAQRQRLFVQNFRARGGTCSQPATQFCKGCQITCGVGYLLQCSPGKDGPKGGVDGPMGCVQEAVCFCLPE